MLEILILIAMCKYLARTATAKGYPGWVFGLLMVFSWFAGGFGLGIAGLVMFGDADSDLPVAGIVGYLLGVALACVGNSLLVAILPARERPDDDYRPSRRSGYDRGDDDYRPRRSRDDDYDDEPRRGRSDDGYDRRRSDDRDYR